MLRREDDFPLREGFDLVIPIGITHVFGSEPVITYYDAAKDIALWLDSLPCEVLFSEKVISELEARISSLGELSDHAFGDNDDGKSSYLFRLDSKDNLNKELILESTVLLLEDDTRENMTDCDLYQSGLACFGTVIDGRIVSAAAENPLFGEADDGNVIDIGVETADVYKGNGYGASNTAALAEYLLDRGKKVSYIAGEGNIASIKIAEKVGFAVYGREYQCAMYKK